MSDDTADKALAGYFDDLLGEEETQVLSTEPVESVKPEETPKRESNVRPFKKEFARRPVTLQEKAHELLKETAQTEAVKEKKDVAKAPQQKLSACTDNLKPAASESDIEPPKTNRQTPEKRPADEPIQPQTKTRSAEPSPDSYVDADLAVLEEQKRQLLQRMLSQQAVREAPVEVKPATEPATKVETKTEISVKTETTVKDEVAVENKVSVEEKVVTTPTEAPVVEQQQVEVVEDAAAEIASRPLQAFLTWGDNGRPRWAEDRFEVLLFDVAGLSLAVPLVALGQIVPMSEKLTVLHGQSDWFMGILPSTVGDIRTINTALFVMPERKTEGFAENAKYVVTIDGFAWGLAVDNVKQPISLEPEDVKWRTERSKRAWLAGTVKSHMCALIDIPQMAEMLEAANRK